MLKNLKKKLKVKDQRGLTLIELLAVIVILGIIAAIAVPSIGNLIQNTKNKATVSEGIQIINAAKMYIAENPDDTEIVPSELDGYLDNIDTSSTTDFANVTVNKSSTGKYTYKLVGHGSVNLVDKEQDGGTKDQTASEAELQNYIK